MTTSIVKIRRKKDGTIVQGCDYYIGRKMTMGGWNLEGSQYGNPFTGDDAVISYWKWVWGKIPTPKGVPNYIGTPDKIQDNAAAELKGKILGCWCKTKKDPNSHCHGDIILELLDQYF